MSNSVWEYQTKSQNHNFYHSERPRSWSVPKSGAALCYIQQIWKRRRLHREGEMHSVCNACSHIMSTLEKQLRSKHRGANQKCSGGAQSANNRRSFAESFAGMRRRCHASSHCLELGSSTWILNMTVTTLDSMHSFARHTCTYEMTMMIRIINSNSNSTCESDSNSNSTVIVIVIAIVIVIIVIILHNTFNYAVV